MKLAQREVVLKSLFNPQGRFDKRKMRRSFRNNAKDAAWTTPLTINQRAVFLASARHYKR